MPPSRYEQFRRALRDLNILAQRDVDLLWSSTGGDLAALAEVLPDVVQSYGSAAASIAADWYEDVRSDQLVAGSYTAILPEPSDPGVTQLLAWAQQEATDEVAFRALIAGGLQRRIANYGRDVVTHNAIRDPRAAGWMRVGHAGCDFCAVLISRGAVYTEASVKFHSHDNCTCGAAPAFNPDQVHQIRGEFTPSARQRSEETRAADNERLRGWIAKNL